MPITTVLMIIGSAMSLLMSVITLTVVITQMKTNVTALSKSEEELNKADQKLAEDLKELLVLLKSFTSTQSVINDMVAQTLKGLVEKSEFNFKQSVSQSKDIEFIHEIMKARELTK